MPGLQGAGSSQAQGLTSSCPTVTQVRRWFWEAWLWETAVSVECELEHLWVVFSKGPFSVSQCLGVAPEQAGSMAGGSFSLCTHSPARGGSVAIQNVLWQMDLPRHLTQWWPCFQLSSRSLPCSHDPCPLPLSLSGNAALHPCSSLFVLLWSPLRAGQLSPALPSQRDTFPVPCPAAAPRRGCSRPSARQCHPEPEQGSLSPAEARVG